MRGMIWLDPAMRWCQSSIWLDPGSCHVVSISKFHPLASIQALRFCLWLHTWFIWACLGYVTFNLWIHGKWKTAHNFVTQKLNQTAVVTLLSILFSRTVCLRLILSILHLCASVQNDTVQHQWLVAHTVLSYWKFVNREPFVFKTGLLFLPLSPVGPCSFLLFA